MWRADSKESICRVKTATNGYDGHRNKEAPNESIRIESFLFRCEM